MALDFLISESETYSFFILRNSGMQQKSMCSLFLRRFIQ